MKRKTEKSLDPSAARIVATLDSVQARLASHKGMILQSQTGEELGALLPSVLDKAFKGEL